MFIPTSSPKRSVADTPLPQSHLCGLFGRQSVLGHQPHLFLTLETRESGRVVFFFSWHSPSLRPPSFWGGSSECFSIYAEGDTYSACPSRGSRNTKSGCWALCCLKSPGEQAESKHLVWVSWSRKSDKGHTLASLAGPGGLGIPWPPGEVQN